MKITGDKTHFSSQTLLDNTYGGIVVTAGWAGATGGMRRQHPFIYQSLQAASTKSEEKIFVKLISVWKSWAFLNNIFAPS